LSKCLITSTPFTAHSVEIHMRGPIEEFEDYDNMIKELGKLTPDDELIIRLNTPGGDCSIGFALISKIMALECPVHMIVEYPTYSMGAIMALCGDSLEFEPDTYIMFHDYSGGSRGKGEETAQYINNFRQVFKDRFTRICKPFLSQKEVDKMFKGEDVYIHHNDPTLKRRIERHFPAMRQAAPNA
jgi:ATP-dependent Clp protease, protease subunit